MDDYITLLYTRNQHSTVNQLYSDIKLKKKTIETRDNEIFIRVKLFLCFPAVNIIKWNNDRTG